MQEQIVSQLDEFADNIDNIVAGHNARFQKLNEAKRALQTQGDTIAQGWEDYFMGEAKKLAAAQAALARISNAPLSTATAPIAPKPAPTRQPLSAVSPTVNADSAISQLPRVAP
jgi:hypothetical protein